MYQVLIVDDEPIVKIALRSMLDWGALGFHICGTASNGQEALEMAERMHPDLIICDPPPHQETSGANDARSRAISFWT